MPFSRYYEDFLENLKINSRLPAGVDLLYPFKDPAVAKVCKTFYKKFYDDENERIFLIGINPGRFGAGVTGIPFTDPVRLESKCGISNPFEKRGELSSVFIYDMVEAFGGVDAFYKHFLITAVSPIGFVKDGKNLNYYDMRELQDALEPFIVASMKKQVAMGGRTDIAFSIGKGKNIAYLEYLNCKYGFFDKIEALPHPRWVMQYRLKRKREMIDVYLDKLSVKDSL